MPVRTQRIPAQRGLDDEIAGNFAPEYEDGPTGAFTAAQRRAAYPYRYAGTLLVRQIAGGIPSDPRVAESWLKTKLGANKDDMIREMVAKTMVERGITAEEATTEVNIMQHLNGFKRDEHGLFIESRQLKAAIKEAVSISVAASKLAKRGWGATNKSLLGYVAEHVFVEGERLHLGVSIEEFNRYLDQVPIDPEARCGIMQRFVSTYRGTGIQYEEYVKNAEINFTIVADHKFTDQEWATIWLTGEKQGIGASRSQGFGTYTVTRWEQED